MSPPFEPSLGEHGDTSAVGARGGRRHPVEVRPALPCATLELAGGVAIPQLGVGLYKVADAEAQAVVETALDLGYRHLDSAAMYGNERAVGRAIATSVLAREELFITSKLDNPYHAPAAARDAFARTLEDLGVAEVDLYLIHWPLPRTSDYVATWRTLLEFRDDGRARAVGVSNFQPAHLEAIIAATGAVPAVNQIEMNPYLTQEQLRARHRALGIVTEAWSPLGRGHVLADPVLRGVAERVDRTPAQVVLRWHLQRGDVVFPKSTHPARLAENADVFDFTLDDAAMAAIAGLNRDERSGSNPDVVEFWG